MTRGVKVVDVLEHYDERLVVGHPGGHWSLTTWRNNKGYCFISVGNRKEKLGHRVAYELFVGPIPDGLELDHLCRTGWCVNPNHLEPVTHEENMRRTRVTVCRAGLHDLTDPDNHKITGGKMRCRLCANAYAMRRYYQNRNTQPKTGST